MHEVLGYCPGCTKTYDRIAVETLTSIPRKLSATEMSDQGHLYMGLEQR